ncbi:MAG: hypothetical protein ACP5IJ_02740 [Candidatus Nanoarchaeia archaeon]
MAAKKPSEKFLKAIRAEVEKEEEEEAIYGLKEFLQGLLVGLIIGFLIALQIAK